MNAPAPPFLAVLVPLVLLAAAAAPGAQVVVGEVKINDVVGGFGGALDDGDRFGGAVVRVDDLDGDGVPELAVGAPWDSSNGPLSGTVWVLFMNADGTVKFEVEIPPLPGAFFGNGIANVGDLDGNGFDDLAVGAYSVLGGSVWILFLDGSPFGPPLFVASTVHITDGQGGFGGTLDNNDQFGFAVAALGDFDGDDVTDLAVGAPYDDDGGADRGAVWILYLNADGTVKGELKISDTSGNFQGTLVDGDLFGWALANVGDLDGDGNTELAVHEYYDDDGGAARGAVWILFLRPDGSVRTAQKISDTEGCFTGLLDDHDHFGSALAGIGDRDGDGVEDLAVGVWQDDDGGNGTNHGAVWLLYLMADGQVKAHQKISNDFGGLVGPLPENEWFGSSVCAMGDMDGDGFEELAVGAWGDVGGGAPFSQRGSVWIVSLDDPPLADVTTYGCTNPPGSLVVLSGAPVVGGSVTFGIDNPLGTQTPGSIPFFVLAKNPDPAYPCGTPIPGWGMQGGGTGILLLAPPFPLGNPLVGPPWAGQFQPSPVVLNLPKKSSLLGKLFHGQGVLFDPVGPKPFGLTRAARIEIGL